ncbi:MAG: CoB--CoM heterodisulfide reductase iron-sulfur subunit B family protein [Candidatus Eisenbacteria bacterium]|nr:CoB--CoM heterodisulfide reductase iron-sulfur subunit B family protein [Candidatus Eisenbacteria bacterium]
MKMGFYPGCSLKGSSREFNESLCAVADKLGMELEEIPDWNCCGATAAHNLNHALALSLPARILAQAEKAGMEEIVVPCSACYNRLVMTRRELQESATLKAEIADIIEMELALTAVPLNVIDALDRALAGSALESLVVAPFAYKVACYYGCLMVRPPKVMQFDQPEDPMTMDRMMERVGAEPIDWAFKVECCGAGLSVSRTDLVAKLCKPIVSDAVKRGAEALIVACPMCQSNLDMRRASLKGLSEAETRIPVLYITQAIGVALGIDRKELGLHRHLVPVALPKPAAKAAGA